MTRDEKVIWAAGFFDGEGCISLSKPTGRSGFRMFIRVTQRYEIETLEILHSLWGGRFVWNERDQTHVWQAESERALEALSEMLPFFVGKKKRAQVAIAFQRRRLRGAARYSQTKMDQQRERDWESYEKMRALNKRGRLTVT